MLKNHFRRSRYGDIIIILLVLLYSCDFDVNDEEPDSELDLKHNLRTTQMFIVHWQATEFGMYQNIWMQQLAGVRPGSVMQKTDRYELEPVYFDDMWSFYFRSCLLGIETLLDQAGRMNAPAYKGIANVLKAYSMLMVTDAWGDIPWQQAHYYFGASGLPAYDDQEMVMNALLSTLDSAIVQLNRGQQQSAFIPDQNHDKIYGGDMDRWIRAAGVVRLRIMLRLANKTNVYQALLEAINQESLFVDNADDMLYPFDGSKPETTNPFYYYDNQVQSSRVGAFIVELLQETGDPRLPRYIKKNVQNQYVGARAGQSDYLASYAGPSVASADAPVVMLSFAEQKFIEAEVYLRTNQQGLADKAFANAVRASLEYHQATNHEWENEHAETDNVTLEQIITAKYTALFLQPETWADFRRTGYPEFNPFTGEKIPRKFLYPQSELSGNQENVPPRGTIFDRIWWDQHIQ